MHKSLLLLLTLSVGCTIVVKDSDDTDAVLVPDTDTDLLEGPMIALNPGLIDFGTVPAQCVTPWRDVTISSVGTETLQITNLRASGNPVFAYDNSSWALPANVQVGSSVTLPVRFEPTAVGVFAGNIIVDSNDATAGAAPISLSGTAAADKNLSETYTQSVMASVDVLFVVDNSGELATDIAALNSRMYDFIGLMTRMGVDYRIGVISTDMDEPTDSGRIEGTIITSSASSPGLDFATQTTGTGNSGSTSERPLDAINQALSSPLIDTVNIGLKRSGTPQMVVVLTDGDDGSIISGTDFATWLDALQGDPALSSLSLMAGPGASTNNCTSVNGGTLVEPAPILAQAVADTGGVHVDICTTDFDQGLLDIGEHALGYRSTFELQFTPVNGTLTVKLDGATTTDYTYDAGTNSVIFAIDKVPAVGVEVTLEYEADC